MDSEPVRRDTPACSVCGEPAVIHQRQEGRYLCGTHLIADLGQRVDGAGRAATASKSK
jgi:hypothetical protein